MIPNYIEKDTLIERLKVYVGEDERNSIRWDDVLDNGYIFDGTIDDVENPYVYIVKSVNQGNTGCVIMVHPIVGNVFYCEPYLSD